MTRTITLLGITLLLAFTTAGGAAAQTQPGAQLCVRAYEDRNGNAVQDPNEPLLRRGLAVELLDGANVVVATATLDASPTAAQGLVCFEGLAAGTYSVILSSATHAPTTETILTRTVRDAAVPVLVAFGGQRLDAAAAGPAALPSSAGRQSLAQRLTLSAIGALLVMGFVLVGGLTVYGLRARRTPPRPAPRATGTVPVVPPAPPPDPYDDAATATGEYPAFVRPAAPPQDTPPRGMPAFTQQTPPRGSSPYVGSPDDLPPPPTDAADDDDPIDFDPPPFQRQR